MPPAELPDGGTGDLRRYAAERAARERGAAPKTGSAIRRWIRAALPGPTRERARTLLTRLFWPYSYLKARELGRRRPLRLHPGCGARRIQGWINIDLVGGGADLCWDLARPLPFPDGVAEAVFAEHLLEHLPLESAIAFAAETRRLLEPGGVVRLGVPDFGRYAAAYQGKGDLIERYRPGRPTPLLALSEVVYLHGHRSLWDEETLVALLREAGFERPRARPFGESAIDPAPDSAKRRVETLYVEAVR